jgi:hypothetical protein
MSTRRKGYERGKHMELKIRTNVAAAILFMVFAGVGWILVPLQIKVPPQATVVTDPSFFPKIFLVALFVHGLMLLAGSIIQKKYDETNYDMRMQLNALSFFGCIIFFVVLIEIIGFLISSIIFSVGSLAFNKCKKWYYYLTVVIIAALIYFAFVFLLKVSLP